MEQCNYTHITGELCEREVRVFLPIAISTLPGHQHGFCEYHAGYIVGMAAAALSPEDDNNADGRAVKRV